MTSRALRFVQIALACTALPAPALTQRVRDPLAGFDAYVERARREWDVPGLAVGVVRNDSVVFLKGYGVRTLGTADSVGVHTLFANASTTKAFTAAVAATLVDEGRLRWDDRVADRLPDFALRDAYATRELTVRDLLTHQLGFGDPQYLWYLHPDDSLPALLPRLRLVPAQWSLRARFAYNNVGYALAGAVEARAGNVPWDALVRRRLLEPLGMRETRTRGAEVAGLADVARPHDLVRDADGREALRPLPAWSQRLVDGVPAAGAMYSSVSDMTRWVRFLLDSARLPAGNAPAGKLPAGAPGNRRRLISDTAFAALFTPQALVPPAEFYPTARLTQPGFTAYGLGWFLQDYAGERVAYHTGSIDGTVALVGLVPARRLGVVIFANRDHAELRHALLWRLVDLHRAADAGALAGTTPRDWSAELHTLYARADSARRTAARRDDAIRARDARPSLPLPRYAGAYADSLYGRLQVRVDSARTNAGPARTGLVLDFAPDAAADLEPLGGDAFRLVWRAGWMPSDVARFRVGADGRAMDLMIGNDAGGPTYARVAGGR